MAKSRKKKKRQRPSKSVAKKKMRWLVWGLVFLVPAIALPFLVQPFSTTEYSYEVVATLPHDPGAYTQGFAYHQGYFFEGTGLYGESRLRKVDPGSGTVLKEIELQDQYFGEGVAIARGTLVQLTWREGKVFVYNSDTFDLLREYNTTREGWGLAFDGERFIASDGSDKLYFHGVSDFRRMGEVHVKDEGRPVKNLNELEFINGEVWANVWKTQRIVRIDPESGDVVGRVDLSGLVKPGERNGREDVLNGIAYDAEGDRLFVTGKRFSHIYQIKLVPKRR